MRTHYLHRGPGISTDEWRVLCDAYDAAAAPLEAAGIDLIAQDHLAGLADMCMENRASGFLPVLPLFDPELSRQHDPSFWLYGSAGGRKVTSVAGVVRHAPNGLESHLEDLTLFYDKLPPGGYAECDVQAGGLDRIAGRLVVMGGLWRLPSLQHDGLGIRMFELGLIEAFSRFKPNWFVGVVHADDTLSLAHQREGFRWKFPYIVYQDQNWGLSKPGMHLTVVALSRHEALDRIRDIPNRIGRSHHAAHGAQTGASLSTAPPTG